MAENASDMQFTANELASAAVGFPVDVEGGEEATGPYGAVYLAWDVPENRKYVRGRAWYAVAALAGAGLLIYAVVSANFLFALIVLMFALILYMNSVGEQRFVQFALTEAGIVLGNAFYPYKDMSRFWMAYEPPAVQALYLETKSGFRTRMSVDLGEQNPNEVRQVLATYVREDLDEDGEPLSDIIGRLLKI